MNGGRAVNARTDLRPAFAGRCACSLLEIDAWIHSEIKATSPLVERLMRLIEGSHCITGQESAVELALREALSNAVVHGNRLDAHKLVHVPASPPGLLAQGFDREVAEIEEEFFQEGTKQ
jgi:hypothetical protein